jgi:predicted GIY-YIG superfamily endonuclease
MYYVYELIDPRTNEIRYIGITARPEIRFTQHLNGINEPNGYKVEWIQELKEQGLLPEMRITETVDNKEEARELERYWIEYYLSRDVQLTNAEHVPITRRGIPQSSSRKRKFFNRLNGEWEVLIEANQPLTTRRLATVFDYYTSDLDIRFPSKTDLVPLWIEKKQKEVRAVLVDPDKYGLLPTFPGDTSITIFVDTN